MANRVITNIYDDAMRPFGLRVTQFAMLASGESRGRLRQADIRAELQLDDSTLSRNLAIMAENGWVEIVAGDSGSRLRATRNGRLLRTTRKGRLLLTKMAPAWQEAQVHASALLGAKTANALRGAADRLLKNDLR